jgi:hypothetical protein
MPLLALVKVKLATVLPCVIKRAGEMYNQFPASPRPSDHVPSLASVIVAATPLKGGGSRGVKMAVSGEVMLMVPEVIEDGWLKAGVARATVINKTKMVFMGYDHINKPCI